MRLLLPGYLEPVAIVVVANTDVCGARDTSTVVPLSDLHYISQLNVDYDSHPNVAGCSVAPEICITMYSRTSHFDKSRIEHATVTNNLETQNIERTPESQGA